MTSANQGSRRGDRPGWRWFDNYQPSRPVAQHRGECVADGCRGQRLCSPRSISLMVSGGRGVRSGWRGGSGFVGDEGQDLCVVAVGVVGVETMAGTVDDDEAAGGEEGRGWASGEIERRGPVIGSLDDQGGQLDVGQLVAEISPSEAAAGFEQDVKRGIED